MHIGVYTYGCVCIWVCSFARQPFHFRFGGKGTSGHFRQVLVGTAEMLAEPIRLHSGQL